MDKTDPLITQFCLHIISLSKDYIKIIEGWKRGNNSTYSQLYTATTYTLLFKLVYILKGSVSSVSLNNFGKPIRQVFQTDFVTFTNDVLVPSPTSADVNLDTYAQDRSFNLLINLECLLAN